MKSLLKPLVPAIGAALLIIAASGVSAYFIKDAVFTEAYRPYNGQVPADGYETAVARRCVAVVALMGIGVWMGALATSPVFLMQQRRSSASKRKISEALERLSRDSAPSTFWHGQTDLPDDTGIYPPQPTRRIIRARRNVNPPKPHEEGWRDFLRGRGVDPDLPFGS
jgi:hypothetical protein